MTVYQHFFSRGRFANYQQIQSEMGFSDPFINEKSLNIGWNDHSNSVNSGFTGQHERERAGLPNPQDRFAQPL